MLYFRYNLRISLWAEEMTQWGWCKHAWRQTFPPSKVTSSKRSWISPVTPAFTLQSHRKSLLEINMWLWHEALREIATIHCSALKRNEIKAWITSRWLLWSQQFSFNSRVAVNMRQQACGGKTTQKNSIYLFVLPLEL